MEKICKERDRVKLRIHRYNNGRKQNQRNSTELRQLLEQKNKITRRLKTTITNEKTKQRKRKLHQFADENNTHDFYKLLKKIQPALNKR